METFGCLRDKAAKTEAGPLNCLLISVGVTQATAAKFWDPLCAAMALFDISAPAEKAAFVAQLCVESGWFEHLEESFNYRPERILEVFPGHVKTLEQAGILSANPQALANTIYAGRFGNGDVASGDGWKYRGKGLIQLTFKDNYARAEKGTGRPYVDQPELLLQPSDACLSAAWFWSDKKCSRLLNTIGIDAVTKAINGNATLASDQRKALYQKALSAFSVPAASS